MSQVNVTNSILQSLMIEWNEIHCGEKLDSELIHIIHKHLNFAYVRGYEELRSSVLPEIYKRRSNNNHTVAVSYVEGLIDSFGKSTL